MESSCEECVRLRARVEKLESRLRQYEDVCSCCSSDSEDEREEDPPRAPPEVEPEPRMPGEFATFFQDPWFGFVQGREVMKVASWVCKKNGLHELIDEVTKISQTHQHKKTRTNATKILAKLAKMPEKITGKVKNMGENQWRDMSPEARLKVVLSLLENEYASLLTLIAGHAKFSLFDAFLSVVPEGRTGVYIGPINSQ